MSARSARSPPRADKVPVVETASTKPKAASADQHREEAQPCIVLGVIVAPGLARESPPGSPPSSAHDLRALETGVDWRIELTVDRLVAPPAQTTEIVDAARRKLLDANWDLGVAVTDLPLRIGRRPVSRQSARRTGSPSFRCPPLAR